MAALQERNGSFRVLFRYHGKQLTLPVGRVTQTEAEAKVGQVEYLLLRLKQGLLSLPPGVDVVTFLAKDGKVETLAPTGTPQKTTLGKLRDRYVEAHEGAHESTSLYTAKIHLQHVVSALGEAYPLAELSLGDMQRFADGRAKKGISPVTVRKEVHTLRAAWNWGKRLGLTDREYPGRGIVYRKGKEKPPFQTLAEIVRRVERGGLSAEEADELWDCLYLTTEELAPFLEHVRENARHEWIYPLVVTAAHTGARRSELIRAKVADVDFDSGVMTVREKKKDRTKTTTRRVPISPTLRSVLTEWLANHPGGQWLFCVSGPVPRSRSKRPTASPITRNEAHHHFKQTLEGSRWSEMRGLHALRHSFVSACASRGIDQRIIETWVGHLSADMQRRYAHIAPSTQAEAMRSVFG